VLIVIFVTIYSTCVSTMNLSVIHVSGEQRGASGMPGFSIPFNALHPLPERVGCLPHRRSKSAAHPCVGQVCRVTSGDHI
jgi:hypothetical protein